jgi:hypothetical protein
MDIQSIMANIQMATTHANYAKSASVVVDTEPTAAESPVGSILPDRVEIDGKRDFLGNVSFNSRLWERSYSVEDAIDRAWQDAAMPIDIFGVRDTPLTGISKDDYIKYRQEMGTDYSMDWERLKNDLMIPATNYSSGDEAIDYFAARYAVLKASIADTANADSELLALNELFGESIKSLVDSMSEKLNSSLESYGVYGEKNTIYNSLLADFDFKVEHYGSLIKYNKDYAGVLGTENEWLYTDDRFLADALRKTNTEPSQASDNYTTKSGTGVFGPKTAGADIYTGRELSSLNAVISMMDHSFRYVNAGASEEEVGFILGSMATKLNVASGFAGFGNKMSSLTSKLFDGYVDKYIDESNKAIDELRNDTRITAKDHSNEAYYDADAIKKIIDFMKDGYKSGMSLEDIFRESVELGRGAYLDRKELYDNELRYENDLSDFWKYYSKAGTTYDYSAPQMSTHDRMMSDWQSFMGVLTGNTTSVNAVYNRNRGLPNYNTSV